MSYRIVLSCFALIVLTGCEKVPFFANGRSVSPSTVSRQIYVMLGHSNMSGRGAEPSSYSPSPNILVYGKDGWKIGTEPTALEASAKVSPGIAFAHAVSALTPGQSIGLINCAYGGSTTYQFTPSYALYDECVARIKTATSDGGAVVGIIASTGENDGTPSDWAESFTNIVRSFRAVTRNPSLPVVYAHIRSDYVLPENRVSVISAQEDSLHIPNVSQISSEGLTTEDGIHFDTASQETLGRRFANAVIGGN